MAGNTFNRKLKYSQVMLAWRSITLRALGVNMNINRFHPRGKKKKHKKTPKQNFPSTHAAIGAISELALRRQRW